MAALKGLSGARIDSSFALTTLADSTERYWNITAYSAFDEIYDWNQLLLPLQVLNNCLLVNSSKRADFFKGPEPKRYLFIRNKRQDKIKGKWEEIIRIYIINS